MREQREGCRGRNERRPITDLSTSPWMEQNEQQREVPGLSGRPSGRVLRKTGGVGSVPESGRCAGRGNGNPLQYSCLGNPWTEEPGGL